MKSLGIVVNYEKNNADEALKELTALAQAMDINVLVITNKTTQHDMRELDAIITLGGDGTMLRAIRLMGDLQIPIIGKNLGRLGFLTCAQDVDMKQILSALHEGKYELYARTLLGGSLHHDSKNDLTFHALNDITLGWSSSSRIVALRLDIDGEYVTTYECDGLIISTPTGSTGHSLSVGGPIIHPSSKVLSINPISPHTLSSRPLIVPDTATITISVHRTHGALLCSVDGREVHPLIQQDYIHISRREYPVYFIQLPEHNYYGMLRKKLNWSGSSLEDSTH